MKKLYPILLVCLGLSLNTGVFAQSSIKFYPVSNPGEVLAEDGNRQEVNLLALKSGDETGAAMTALYVRGERMPQYLIAPTASITRHNGFITARFLTSLKDAEGKPGRLAFRKGTLYDDGELHLPDSVMNVKATNDKGEGGYSPALYSFRLTDQGEEENFLIEAWTAGFGSEEGEWVKIENGTPIIVRTTLEKALAGEAEVFNTGTTSAPDTRSATDENSALAQESDVKVYSGKGYLTIAGAAGKEVRILNTQGKSLVHRKITYDRYTVSVPAGVALISINGKQAIKAVVK